MLLSGSSAWAPQPEPLPSRPGPPAPPPPGSPLPRLGQWPRRLDTPSLRPASRFLCQTKRDGRRGPGGGCAGAAPQREAWPAEEGRGPSSLVQGSRHAGVGLGAGRVGVREELASLAYAPAPASRTGQERPLLRGQRAYTALGHTYQDVDVHTHSTPADVHTQLTQDTPRYTQLTY